MAELRDRFAELDALGFRLVALSVDEPRRSLALADQLDLPFTLLADPSREIVTRWGLLNPREKGGIAFPATFVIDRDRVVRFRSLDRTAKRVVLDDLFAFLRAGIDSNAATPRRSGVVPRLRDFLRVTGNVLRHGLRSPKTCEGC